MSGEFEVAKDGSIHHPLYRHVSVGGVPVTVAEQRIRTYLERFAPDPEFVVEPLFRVIVMGEVRQPGVFALAPHISIAQAVAQAGGPTDSGRLNRVRLVRAGELRTLDLVHPSGTDGQIAIRSGDQILVERKQNLLRDVLLPSMNAIVVAISIINLVR